MTVQINRTYKLLIGDYKTGNGLEIDDLQVSFDVSKSSDNSKNTNSASIELTNLSSERLKVLETDYPVAAFYCGYNGNNKLLFAGEVTHVSTRKSGTERISQILMGTGYTELNHQNISKVVPAGRTVKDVMDEIVKQFPSISRASYNGTNLNNPVTKGYPLSGTVKEALDKVCDTYNLEWRIDDEVLYVNDKDRAENENFNLAFIITPESGLIEIPYYVSGDIGKSQADKNKKQGVQFGMLLNPEIYAGRIIKLEDTEITGWFKVDSARYYGSWRNGNWMQDIKCSAIEKVVKTNG